MSLARIRFLQRKLEEKYGPKGYIAGLYVEAGFDVTVDFPVAGSTVDILAKKGGTLYAIDVLMDKRVYGPEVVERIVEKAKKLNATPVLVLYGAGPSLSKEAMEKAREAGVRVRRVRR